MTDKARMLGTSSYAPDISIIAGGAAQPLCFGAVEFYFFIFGILFGV